MCAVVLRYILPSVCSRSIGLWDRFNFIAVLCQCHWLNVSIGLFNRCIAHSHMSGTSFLDPFDLYFCMLKTGPYCATSSCQPQVRPFQEVKAVPALKFGVQSWRMRARKRKSRYRYWSTSMNIRKTIHLPVHMVLLRRNLPFGKSSVLYACMKKS